MGVLPPLANTPDQPINPRSKPRKKPKPLAHGTYPLLLVEWLDALVDQGWSDVNAALTPAAIKSVGWKINEDAKCIVLSADIGDSEDGTTKAKTTETNRRIAIPRDWVTSIKEL